MFRICIVMVWQKILHENFNFIFDFFNLVFHVLKQIKIKLTFIGPRTPFLCRKINFKKKTKISQSNICRNCLWRFVLLTFTLHFIYRLLADGENVKTNQKWITRNYLEDFDTTMTKTSLLKHRASVTSIDSYVTFKLCWVVSLRSSLPWSASPPPGLLKMIKRSSVNGVTKHPASIHL